MACVVCDIVEGNADATVVYEDDRTLGFFPLPEGRLADGHVVVVPKRHCSDLFDAPESDLRALVVAVRRVAEALRSGLGATGVNVLNASGPNSDQSVFHLHFHVVPRWSGDSLDTWPTGTFKHRVVGDPATLLRNVLMSGR